MEEKRLNDKLYHYLLDLFDTRTTYDIHEFLTHSVIYIEDNYSIAIKDGKIMHIVVDPVIYKKYQGLLHQFKPSIRQKFMEFSHRIITKVEVYPDLNKFQILQNAIVPIITPWEEINKKQDHLINLLKTAKETIDYQNVGNAARTLLQKLADIVFKADKHKSDTPDIDLSEGRFKNRLHTYIKSELGGKENKELRDFAISAITTAEKSVDLANKLTHDLNADSLLAETCTISVITVVSIIKLTIK